MQNPKPEKRYGVVASPGNKKFIGQMRKNGASVVEFPEIDIRISGRRDSISGAIDSLSGSRWIIFTDIHSVEAFFEILSELGLDPLTLDDTMVCAFGEAVTDRLRFRTIHADVIPSDLDPRTVLDAIESFVVSPEEFSGLGVLIVKEAGAKLEISSLLRERVKWVEEIGVYRCLLPGVTEIARFQTLIAGGAIDEFVFCTPEDVMSLRAVLGDELIVRVLREIKPVVSDPLAFQTLREFGVKPSMRAQIVI